VIFVAYFSQNDALKIQLSLSGTAKPLMLFSYRLMQLHYGNNKKNIARGKTSYFKSDLLLKNSSNTQNILK